MLKRFNLNLPEIDDNTMYDVNDFIQNFQQFGSGLTFEETIDFFLKEDVISKEEVMNYINNNAKDMDEIKLMVVMDSITSNTDIRSISKLSEDFDDFAKSCIEKNPLLYQNALERILKNREFEYNYFNEYAKRLKDKGIIYLSLIKFIANNKEEQKDHTYWENLLLELDINFDGTKIMGEDLKRILRALFNSQTRLKDKLDIANNLETYKRPSLTEYAKIGAKHGSEEMYPSISIVEKYKILSFENMDDTSIEFNKRQLKELQDDAEEKVKKFLKGFITDIWNI